MIFKLNTLYKRDSNGKVREYTIEYTRDGVLPAGYRTVAGIQGGKLVTSEWKLTEGKNIGKVNATTDGEQAEREAIAKWEKKEEKEYFESIEQIDNEQPFKPMLAHDYTKRPQSSGWSQPKLDGIRCIATKNGLFTRAGKEITTCNHIVEDLKEFFESEPEVKLDGELYNHQLKADFNKITSLVRKVKPTVDEEAECRSKVQYHVYDMFTPEHEFPFNSRNQFLKQHKHFQDFDHKSIVQLVETTLCASQDLLDSKYAEYTEQGYEGQMVRNNEPYECKRSKHLLKRKEFITEEFKVVQVLEGSGNWSGYAKHFELELEDGRVFGSGVRGNQATLKHLLYQEEQPTWVTCRYFEKTPDGIPRFPVVIDWGVGERED